MNERKKQHCVVYRGGHEKGGGSKICTVRAFDLIPSAFNRSRNFKTTGTIVAAPEADMTS